MPGINNRVFGSDIENRVKKKLEARQLLAEKNRNPLDPITSNYKQDLDDPNHQPFPFTHGQLNDLNFDGVADLSSRTPFVRMWAAIEVRTHANDGIPQKSDEINPKSYESAPQRAKVEMNKKIDNGKTQKIKVVKHEKIIYEIGNHTLNEFSNPLDVRQVTNKLSNDGIKSTDVIPNIFETNQNEFMKPAAGITSVTSNTEGALGSIKKTTINFIVHNFHDYDKIYSKYFLRPGAQVFVDFGWDSLKELYKPQDLIDDKKITLNPRGNSIEEILFGESGYVTDSYGDLETIIGIVNSFDAKIKEDGSVECVVELTSKNAALIQSDVDNKLKNRIQYLLDAEIMDYASKYFEDFNLLNPDWTNSAESINDYTKLSFLFAADNLKGEGNIPTKNSLTTGVYWQTVINSEGGVAPGSTKNIYVSIGFFEDKILNGEFGVGRDLINILGENIKKDGGNFEARFDSSESYVRWDKNLFNRQKYEKNATDISYIYPNDWSNTYNTKRNKTPSVSRDNFFVGYTDDEIVDLEKNNFNKMPIRELFVSLQVIKNSFKNNDSISDAILDILKIISDDSQEVFDLNLTSSTLDNTKLSIVDRNLLNNQKNSEEEFFKKLFMFKPMSKGSIVKSYDLSISIPKGNFQSMLAIQTMPTGKSLLPLDSIIDKYLGLNMLNKDENSQIGVVYLPEIGVYQTEKVEQDNALDSEISFNFDNDYILKSSDNNSNTLLDSLQVSFSDKVSFDGAVKAAENKDETVKDNRVETSNKITDSQLEETKNNQWTASSVSQFYKFLAKRDNIDKVPTLLSIASLSLTIYGISSLAPGDLFRVDYLPERQRNLLYFQITKVTQNVNQSTWSTTIETVPRIRAIKKSESGLYFKPKDVVISKTFLNKIIGSTAFGLTGSSFDKYIKNLKFVGNGPDDKFDYIFEFESKHSPKITFDNQTWEVRNIPHELKVRLNNITYQDFEFKLDNRTGKFSAFPKYSYEYKVDFVEDEKYKILVKGSNFVIVPSKLFNYDSFAKDFNEFLSLESYKQSTKFFKGNLFND